MFEKKSYATQDGCNEFSCLQISWGGEPSDLLLPETICRPSADQLERCTSCIMMSTISPNVDFVGHFAGMLAGFLLAIILADMQEADNRMFDGLCG